jgi:hypothetical protein
MRDMDGEKEVKENDIIQIFSNFFNIWNISPITTNKEMNNINLSSVI